MSARVEVGLFGDRRVAEVTRNRRNWKVSWRSAEVDSFVPIGMAINAREAAMQAARVLESYKWGHHVLMAGLRGAVSADGAMSTELAMWINAKAAGKPFDRHERVQAGRAVIDARTALAAYGATP